MFPGVEFGPAVPVREVSLARSWSVAILAALAFFAAESLHAQSEGEWVMPGKTFAGLRFSALDQINTENAGNLRVAWTFSLGVLRGQEAAPIVAGNTNVVTPYPNLLYALDLAKPGAPVKWKFEPKPDAASQGVACCDHLNRGAAYADGRVFFNTLDGQTFAIDAATGREVWRAKLASINKGESITMAPLVAKNKVLVGVSGGEFGVRGWLTALDAATGKIAWRAYSTGPDKDVLIGPRFKPFYDMDKGQDLGVSTWPPTPGRSAAARSGAGSPTTPRATSFTTAPAIRAPGTRTSGPATTNGPRASSRATSIPARPSGSTNGRPATSTTMTASTRTCCSTSPTRGSPARS